MSVPLFTRLSLKGSFLNLPVSKCDFSSLQVAVLKASLSDSGVGLPAKVVPVAGLGGGADRCRRLGADPLGFGEIIRVAILNTDFLGAYPGTSVRFSTADRRRRTCGPGVE
jgi:hypothetical protein